jgi:hypothetical protein
MSGLLLVSLDEYKTYKGITKENEDAKIVQLLEGASNLAKEFCKRSFIDYYSTAKVEYHDGSKYDTIFLDELPLNEITSVEISLDGDFDTVDKVTALVAYESYYPNKEDSLIFSGVVGYPLVYGAVPGTANIKITYTGGYENTPKDMKLAVMDLVEYYRQEEYTPRKAFKDMSIENLGFRENSNSSLPSHIKRIFEMYRRLE